MTAPLERLIQLIGRLPGLGPRSARRIVLHLLKRRDAVLGPLVDSLQETAANVSHCSQCGNLDAVDPCHICTDPKRDASLICVVEDVADLWALERSGAFRGLYHVLGGTLSALDGVRPEDLRLGALLRRVEDNHVREVILALNATVEGQTTAHYVAERLADLTVAVTRLSHGLPVGGELDYLDDGTLMAALQARRQAG